MSDLVAQTAGYLSSRTPPPAQKRQQGGGFGSHLNPMQFGRMLKGGGGAADVGEATGGGILPVLEEAAPLMLA